MIKRLLGQLLMSIYSWALFILDDFLVLQQKARDNRAALRITRAQNSVKPRKRASADPLQSLAPSELDSYVSRQTSLVRLFSPLADISNLSWTE